MNLEKMTKALAALGLVVVFLLPVALAHYFESESVPHTAAAAKPAADHIARGRAARESIRNGELGFIRNCGMCHGFEASGKVGVAQASATPISSPSPPTGLSGKPCARAGWVQPWPRDGMSRGKHSTTSSPTSALCLSGRLPPSPSTWTDRRGRCRKRSAQFLCLLLLLSRSQRRRLRRARHCTRHRPAGIPQARVR